MAEKFIRLQSLYSLVEWEPFILIGLLLIVTWLFYKSFLQEASAERHRNIRGHFKTLIRHFAILSVLFFLFNVAKNQPVQDLGFERGTPYLALLTFLWGNIVFVKTCRLLVLQYMFLGSMKHGVPLLIVNMFSLLLSILLGFWGISTIFGVQLGPLLATSAAFSIILGLALQDTLGNLFAGISLQLDKNYEIGDWIEGVSGVQKVTGQVREISWRSTTLVGLSDEIIILPNRWMAQAQLSNYSPPDQPIIRSQSFRLAYGSNTALAKETLEQMAAGIGEIRGIPAPIAYVQEANEHWISMKIAYFLDNYGSQYMVGDKVLNRGLEALQAKGIQIARQVLEVQSTNNGHE